MVQSDPTDAHGNLFPIFLLSLIQFFLVPITLWRVGSWAIDAAYGDKEKKGAAASAVAAPTDVSSEWGKAAAARAARNRPTAARRLRALFSGANLWLLAFWAVSAALAAYIAFSQVEEAEHFDPYKVLNVPVGADASVIKKAYRALSLQYHPDKLKARLAAGIRWTPGRTRGRLCAALHVRARSPVSVLRACQGAGSSLFLPNAAENGLLKARKRRAQRIFVSENNWLA